MRDVTLLTSNGVNVAKSLELFGDMTTYDSTLSDFLADINEKENKIKRTIHKNTRSNRSNHNYNIGTILILPF